MDETITADVYRADFLGDVDEDGYLWDFGVFQCYGSEAVPWSLLEGYQRFQAWAYGMDAKWLHEESPEKTVEVPVVEYDYGLFVETSIAYATHLIDSEGIPREMDDGIEIEGDNGCVLTVRNRRRRAREAMTMEEVEKRLEDGWMAVLRVAN